MKVRVSMFFLVLVLSFAKSVQAQVYAGGGFVYSSLSKSGLDDVTGFGIDIQKEMQYAETKLNFVPTIHLSVLHSNVFRQVNAFYANSVVLSPSFSYKLIESKRISISPFASPFLGWLFAYRREDLLFEAGNRNEAIYGFEFGLEFKIEVYENLELKINPITLQIGDNDFRQGMVSVLFRLSK
ncbi:hypothetical protein SAMN05661096_01046 [Marivirga sericea]|uniref:Outer membrane protein beta-barrel domain-containing protein n=1 Tax=Marivirga sericea TaxID=1028 RepID=A0A1X7IUM0_9BACT|nr:hypothetical protein [Marivirga sericea]SMG18246.1 hypothetical protein SAMN05661096_01046 [Marivirga sericea]